MGYRHYMYIVPRKRIEEVKDLTYEELKRYAESNGIFNEDGEDDFCAYSFLSALGEHNEFFCYGKYYENYESIQKLGTPLFSNAETMEHFEEYEPYVVERDAILCAIDYYRERVVKWCKDLIMSQEEYNAKYEPWQRDKRSREERIIAHLESQLSEWENPYGLSAIDTNMKNNRIVQSWLYEYEIFELVHKMKTMDWENNAIIFYGW